MSYDDMREEFQRCREQQNSMEATLAEFGKRLGRFEGHMFSISNDINMTSKTAENNALAVQGLISTVNQMAQQQTETRETVLFIKEWTGKFKGFASVSELLAGFIKWCLKWTIYISAAGAIAMGAIHYAQDKALHLLDKWR
jgi:hypothetical protein